MSNHSDLLNTCNHPLYLYRSIVEFTVSPLQYSRTVLVDQRLVVRLQLVDVGQLGGFCVEVKFAVERMEDAASGQSSEQDSNVHVREEDAHLNSCTQGSMRRSFSSHRCM